MNYNKEYLDIKFAMIQTFLINAENNILDISYNIKVQNIEIQFVLLAGTTLSNETISKVKMNLLSNFEFSISTIHLTKEEFNKSKGKWKPENYIWLQEILFSKAEVL